MRSAHRWFVVFGLLISGCDPTDVPRFSPDGKKIAVLVPSEHLQPNEVIKDPTDVGIVTVATGRTASYPLPDGWSADGVQWIGDKVLVAARRPLEKTKGSVPSGEVSQGTYWLLDPEKRGPGRFVNTGLEPYPVLTPFTGFYRGNPCVYLPQEDTAEDSVSEYTKILALNCSTELGTLPYGVAGAGDGWMIRVVQEKIARPLVEDKHAEWILESLPGDERTRTTKDIAGLELFNPEGKRVIRISREEIGKACYRGPRRPVCARISSTHRCLLLGFDTGTIFRRHTHEYTYGVYGVNSGKLLWRGNSNALRGLPVFEQDSVFALEAKSRDIDTGDRTAGAIFSPPQSTSGLASEIVLARHTRQGRKVVVELPLHEGEKGNRYSASPDRKNFVLLLEGKQPRMLIIPIRENVKEEDISQVLLKPS